MYNLICTTYTITKNGLMLRNNWIEQASNDFQLRNILTNWKISTDFKYPSKGTISNILCGEFDLENVEIHVRIVRF